MNENIMPTQINQILEIVKSHDNRFNAIEAQIDERFDMLSEQIYQLDKQHGERLIRLETMVSQHDNQIGKLADKVDSMYKWIIGLILGLLLPMWASIIIAILLK